MTKRLPSNLSGRHDAAPYLDLVREAWRTKTLGELAADTGISPTVLHEILHGQERISTRTAARLEVWKRLREHEELPMT